VIKPRFNLTQLFLAVTWACIVLTFLYHRFAPLPYEGSAQDIAGYTFTDYGLEDRFETTITDEIVARASAWPPGAANPPVSARKALLIANRFRQTRLVDKNNWKWGLESVSLLPLDGKSNKWCWSILFSAFPEEGGFSGIPPEFTVIVLMDGTVIEPETTQLEVWERAEIVNTEENGPDK
jgi:hypothetical protein